MSELYTALNAWGTRIMRYLSEDDKDDAARILCEIIDDNAPLNWQKYRPIVTLIANNDKLFKLLNEGGQRQTLEEFKASGFVGLCWIFDNDGNVFAHNYDGEYFTNPHMPGYPIHNERIHRVMPIPAPDASK